MPDQFNSEERSAIMRSVRSIDTDPERRVRQIVRRLGFRFRQNCKLLPGTPDLVLSNRRQVVFVHGCYWHQHRCEASKRPATNRNYWNRKLDMNVERDKKNKRLLKAAGWKVLTIWECELRKPERATKRLANFLKAEAA